VNTACHSRTCLAVALAEADVFSGNP